MSFKENLLKKVAINRLAQKVTASWGPPASGGRMDRALMEQLLTMGPYQPEKKRDLTLYRTTDPDFVDTLLVLDNELGIYRAAAEDIALRKSPTVKEMVSIRNIRKILNDTDILVSKKETSLETVRRVCINQLDLNFTRDDLNALAADGKAALQNAYTQGVVESLHLFAEIAGFKAPPKAFRHPHHEMIGALAAKTAGETIYGPIAMYSKMHNRLQFIGEAISSYDKQQMKMFQAIANGQKEVNVEGEAVFDHLAGHCYSRHPGERRGPGSK